MDRHRQTPGMSHGARKDHRRGASSLIELLVVISIIGVLVTMLLPSLKRSMQLASTTICMHNLREIGHSLTLYRVENDGWLPMNRAASTTAKSRRMRARSERKKKPDVWFVKLFPAYLGDPLALTCPEDPFRYRMVKSRDRWDEPEIVDFASYGLNSFMLTAAGGRLADLDRHTPTRPLDTILAADLGPDHLAYKPTGKGSAKLGPSRNKGLLSWDDGYNPLAMSETATPWLTMRHGKGINMLTLAGGVRSAQTKELARWPVRTYYRDCAGGGCTLCALPSDDRLYHYSFARDHLYWWTGPLAAE